MDTPRLIVEGRVMPSGHPPSRAGAPPALASRDRPLVELGRVVEAQLAVLDELAARPASGERTATEAVFPLLLDALGATFDALARAPDTSEELRELGAALAARIAARRAAQPELRAHLVALAEGWSCGACRARVPKGATLSGARVGLVRVELVCQRCGKGTKLAAAGQRHFDAVFGPLVGTAWSPRASGFEGAER
jgi:hypothetical protein